MKLPHMDQLCADQRPARSGMLRKKDFKAVRATRMRFNAKQRQVRSSRKRNTVTFWGSGAGREEREIASRIRIHASMP